MGDAARRVRRGATAAAGRSVRGVGRAARGAHSGAALRRRHRTDRAHGAAPDRHSARVHSAVANALKARLEQAVVITDWASIVGRDIAKVAQPVSISRQGVLTVAVTNAAWMTELAMMELELLRVINEKSGRAKVDRIRWRLVR
ncbi:MAG: hypothetical protein B7Z72_00555 [Gemmatimonadetes bacterium 21-71-4]|nr:MAG: hypothetical protein B7Z72_00555 [Gemmatimonadetes bacterium 21-71-4]